MFSWYIYKILDCNSIQFRIWNGSIVLTAKIKSQSVYGYIHGREFLLWLTSLDKVKIENVLNKLNFSIFHKIWIWKFNDSELKNIFNIFLKFSRYEYFQHYTAVQPTRLQISISEPSKQNTSSMYFVSPSFEIFSDPFLTGKEAIKFGFQTSHCQLSCLKTLYSLLFQLWEEGDEVTKCLICHRNRHIHLKIFILPVVDHTLPFTNPANIQL